MASLSLRSMCADRCFRLTKANKRTLSVRNPAIPKVMPMIRLLLTGNATGGLLLVVGLTPEVTEVGIDVDETVGVFVKVAGGMAIISLPRPSIY